MTQTAQPLTTGTMGAHPTADSSGPNVGAPT
jgi:hypothetical protein